MNWVFGISIATSFLAALVLLINSQFQSAAIASTLTAILAALFKEEVAKLWRKPKIRLRIQLEPPDCVLMPSEVLYVDNEGKERVWQGSIYFFRLRVENVGNSVAERVQVFVNSVKYKRGDSKLEPVADFVPMNLRWANSPDPSNPILFETLNPKMGKHCDFGSVSPVSNPTQLPRPGMDPNLTTFNLWVEVFPNNRGHCLPPSTYVIELLVAGSNVQPHTVLLDLEWNGRFREPESVMYSESVKLRLIEE